MLKAFLKEDKPIIIEYIKVYTFNCLDLSRFLGQGEKWNLHLKDIFVPTSKGLIQPQELDYIIKKSDQLYEVMTEEEFRSTYKEFTEYEALRRLCTLIDELGLDVEEIEIEEKCIEGVHFLLVSKENEFIASGDSLRELLANIYSRYVD